MSISMYQSSVKRLQDEVAGLRKKLGELSKKKADVIGDISRTTDSMARTKSLSTLKSKQRDLERLYDKLGDIEKQQSDLEKKIATKSNDLSDNQIKLNKAIEDEEKKRARERKNQLDKEIRQTQALNDELKRSTSLTTGVTPYGLNVTGRYDSVIPFERYASSSTSSLNSGDGDSTPQKRPKRNKTQSKPWDDTLLKLEKLRSIREESKQTGQIIKWTSACNQAGIEPRIAKKHAPELRSRWYDNEF